MGTNILNGVAGWKSARPYRVFIDELEVRGYTIVAVLVRPSDVHKIRRILHTHLRSNQRSLHFTNERPSVRRAVVSDIQQMNIGIEIYHLDSPPKVARPKILKVLARRHRRSGCQQLVLDQDDSVLKPDKQVLSQELSHGWDGTFDHLHAREEPLLWLPDAIAWCWCRGGEWKRMARLMRPVEVPITF